MSSRRGSHTRTGTAAEKSEGLTKGWSAGGLLRSPARSPTEAIGPAPVPPPWDVLEEYDWFTFNCTGCGEETFVGREPEQSVSEFKTMCDWLYGSPPVCSFCLSMQSI